MTNTKFLTRITNVKNVSKENTFKENIFKLLDIAKSSGLSVEELGDVTDAIISLNLEEKLFQTLVHCLIPNNTIPPNIIKKLMLHILTEYENEYCVKVESLLQWVASVLDYHLVEENVVDEFYCLLWSLLPSYPKVVSHLIYILTKPQDVTLWRVKYIQNLMVKIGPVICLCILLKRFKELNSKFSYITVPTHRKTEKVFHEKSPFYCFLRENLKNLHLPGSAETASIVVPLNQMKKNSNKKYRDLVPQMQYLQKDCKFDQLFIENIRNGKHFAKNFQNIQMPSYTLSLLNSIMGIRVLMFAERNVQEHFMQNLCAILKRSIFQQGASKTEIETLLNNVIILHCAYQQGFIELSSFLKLYLQFWDGVQYRMQIYKLLEWFVFKSNVEMNRFILKPLYTLFVSSSTEEMCDILSCLINLLTNLYLTVGKDDENSLHLLEENVLRSRNELTPVIISLTKFISKLIKIGLYIYPCNNQILLVAISFYEKVNYLEQLYNMPLWTIFSSNVLYHSLLSFNAQLFDQICSLYKRYNIMEQLPIARSTPKMEEKARLLRSYGGDLYNFLWSSRAFADRIVGHIFRGLSYEDEANWKNFVNLNNSLNLQRHVMFAPYLMNLSGDNISCSSSFQEKWLSTLKLQMPNLFDLIEIYNQRSEDEFD